MISPANPGRDEIMLLVRCSAARLAALDAVMGEVKNLSVEAATKTSSELRTLAAGAAAMALRAGPLRAGDYDGRAGMVQMAAALLLLALERMDAEGREVAA